MITLYHGSHSIVSQPLTNAGRLNLDFGKGFYLTKIKIQAETWAKIVASRYGRDITPVLNEYVFDDVRAEQDEIRIKRFMSYDMEWLDYVISCRNGKDYSDVYDVVEGGVANDKVIDTVEDYEKGIISARQALGQLEFKKLNHQMCILNQPIIEKYLLFVNSYKL